MGAVDAPRQVDRKVITLARLPVGAVSSGRAGGPSRSAGCIPDS
jgi:hypothetical protein